MDLPVKANADILDFKTCMIGNTYCGRISLYNSSRNAMKAHISAPLCTAGCVSLAPSCAFVQGHGQLLVSVNFTPTTNTARQCREYMNPGDLHIEVPITITVPQQPLPLKLICKACLNNPDLQFEKNIHDLGVCNVNERSSYPVLIRNTSTLEQAFAITGMPQDVYVQPCTGCIPPMQHFQVNVILTPKVAGVRSFQVLVQSLYLSTATLSFQAVVTQPSISISHSLVKLKATAFSGSTTSSVVLQNHAAVSQNFAFDDTESGVSITPASGCLAAGCELRVQIDYIPQGLRALKCLEQTGRGSAEVPACQHPLSEIWIREKINASRLPLQPIIHMIKCYFCAPGEDPRGARCISLEVRTCDVKPGAVLVGASVNPHSGRLVCDFGISPIGSSTYKTLLLQNVSGNDVRYKCKPLNPFGPFEQVTASRLVTVDTMMSLKLRFAPRSGGTYMEVLHVQIGALSLLCELHGAAEEPTWNLTLLDVPKDMSARARSGTHAVFEVENPCHFPCSCILEAPPVSVPNIGNCPVLVVHPCSITSGAHIATDVQLSYRPDWQVQFVYEPEKYQRFASEQKNADGTISYEVTLRQAYRDHTWTK